MALKAASIAMSFASAILTFNNCNSCSILSRVRFDKSLSESVVVVTVGAGPTQCNDAVTTFGIG